MTAGRRRAPTADELVAVLADMRRTKRYGAIRLTEEKLREARTRELARAVGYRRRKRGNR